MTNLPPLPECAFELRWDAERTGYFVSKPSIGDTNVYTADQMQAYARAAIDAAIRSTS